MIVKIATAYYAETSKEEFIKLALTDGNVHIMRANAGHGKEAAKTEIENGELDFVCDDPLFILLNPGNTPEEVAEFDEKHPTQELIYQAA